MEYTDGTVKFKVRRLGGGGDSGVLSGTILAFSGTFSTDGYPINSATGDADKTWHLCDGTNGTPDLRGRFILGASDSHAKGDTGGEENHQLTESELPKVTINSTGTTNVSGQHKHRVKGYQTRTGSSSANAEGLNRTTQGVRQPFYYDTEEAGGHDHTVTASGTFGGGQTHNNMPPFYTLSYIMKL